MPLCVKCGKALECTVDCAPAPRVGSGVQPCPLMKGALWVRVTDDAGTDLKDAPVGRAGQKKTTDASGVAVYDPVESGTYAVTIEALDEALTKKYALPATKSYQAKVSMGEITFVAFELARKAPLKVKVQKKGVDDFLKATTVKVTGPENPPDVKTDAITGIADFGMVEPGTYTIKTTLDVEDAKTLRPSKDSDTVDVRSGDDKTTRVDVEPIVVVTPKIAVEYKVLLLDRKLAAHQADTEKKHPPSPTYVLLSLAQDPADPKYTTKGALLTTEPEGMIEAYAEAALTTKIDLTAAIANDKLTAAEPYKVFLKALKKGKFDLKLTAEDPAAPAFKAGKEAVEKMAVVELEFKLHQFDTTELAALEVDPDTGTVDQYHTALEGKSLPAQKEMTDVQKVKNGRVLHVQDSGNAGRAQLILKKLVAAEWPDGTDDYKLVFQASESEAPDTVSASIEVFDAEKAGTKKALPLELRVGDLKAADTTLWVEGTAASKKAVDIRLDLGIDRAVADPPKTPKRNGDWARFSVVKIAEVKVDYEPVVDKPVAWDDGEEKFYINLKADPEGRKLNIGARLTEKIEGIVLHFMLAADVNNGKAANWGKDMPGTWVWKDIAAAVKHKDRTDRKKVLHVSAKTDATNGYAKAEVVLSRFGGDKFKPAAYVEQDPHLAKYIDGHAELKKRKPILAAKVVTVWRKFWYHEVTVEGVPAPSADVAEATYTDMKATMAAYTKHEVSRTDVDLMSPRIIYPKYMIGFPDDTSDGVVLGDGNIHTFTGKSVVAADKPLRIPIAICHAYWIRPSEDVPAGSDNTGAKSTNWAGADTFPIRLDMGEKCLKPPLQGGTLYVSGTMEARESDGINPPSPVRSVALTDAEIDIPQDRGAGNGRRVVSISVPAGLHAVANTEVRLRNLVIRAARSYLGSYAASHKDIGCFANQDAGIYHNTLVHEIGHALHQVAQVLPTGIPAHPDRYSRMGSHCGLGGNDTNGCVMYGTGSAPKKGYCTKCHPYVLVQDMSTLA